MDEEARTQRPRATPGRRIVVAIVAIGGALGLFGFLMRGARGPSLPFKPGSLVLVTTTAAPGEGDDAETTRFSCAVAPSSERVANLGALLTGRMPRENGLVRAGGRLRADVPTLAEVAADQGFATKAFIHQEAAGDSIDWKGAGLLRGFTEVDGGEGAGGTDHDVALHAAEWIVARGTSPAFALVHLSGGKSSAPAEQELCDRLRERGVLGHTTLVRVHSLALGGWHLPLTLRLPAPILPHRVDERPVSLIDVVPSVCEVFGIRLPDGPGPPFLLDPNWRGPRYVLATRPLRAPYEDADEIALILQKMMWVDFPTTRNADEIDAIVRLESPGEGERPVDHDPALSADFRKVVGEVFGYRFEEVEFSELLRTQVVDPLRAEWGVPATTRVQLARFGAKRAGATPAAK